MLAYTLQRLLTERAVIERDIAPADAYGADRIPDWHHHLTVPCRLWWATATGARSSDRTYVDANRTVPLADGGLLMELGTDITERDRISAVTDPHGNVKTQGLFTISVVLDQHDHLEVMVIRPHLGA